MLNSPEMFRVVPDLRGVWYCVGPRNLTGSPSHTLLIGIIDRVGVQLFVYLSVIPLQRQHRTG